jgi:putative ABC transport system permease protein
MLSRLNSALRALLRRSHAESELDEELRYHIEQQTEQNIRLGMNPEEARLAALKSFGGVEQAKELSRDARGVRWLEGLWRDLRYGARLILKNPGFTAVAAITLAMGIGANTAIFSFINTVFFLPLPAPDSDRIVWIQNSHTTPSWSDYIALRDRSGAFSQLALYNARTLLLKEGDTREKAVCEFVTGNYFEMLGIQPAMGRTFLPEEDRAPGTHPVVVISHRLWKNRFGADPNIIGRSLTLGNEPMTVIGVAPDNVVVAFATSNPDLWAPVMMTPRLYPKNNPFLYPDDGFGRLIGKLKPGADLAQAQAAVNTIASAENEARRARTKPGQEVFLLEPTLALARGIGIFLDPIDRERLTLSFAIVISAVFLVLFISCANVANLLLARAVARRKEITLRRALGASRIRIARQLLTESVLLSLLGGAAGLLLAHWIIAALKPLLSYSPSMSTLLWAAQNQTPVDFRVLSFTFLISILSGIIFGIAPALNITKVDLTSNLKDISAAPALKNRFFSLRNLLVFAQVSVSIALLICAGLLIRTLRNTQDTDPGFQMANRFSVNVQFDDQRYGNKAGRLFIQRLLERTRSLPGVRSASLGGAPLVAYGGYTEYFSVEGEPEPSLDQLAPQPMNDGEFPANRHSAWVGIVDTDYFETLGIPLLKGRDFNGRDIEGNPSVIIVNETLARRISPDGNAVGKRIKVMGQEGLVKVVGIAKNIKYFRLWEKPMNYAYRPWRQLSNMTYGEAVLCLLTSGEPGDLAKMLQEVVSSLAPNLPPIEIGALEENTRSQIAPARLFAVLSGAFGLLALGLTAVGIYGLMAYTVNGRTREIGIRMALGAYKNDVLKMILLEGLILVMIGIGIGITSSIAITVAFKSLLFGVSGADPLTYILTSLLLILVALLACWVPARRAARVDPMTALRFE